MLLERRSVKELEDILTERLELLRGGEIGPAHLHRADKKRSLGLLTRLGPSTGSTTSPRTTWPWPSGPWSGPLSEGRVLPKWADPVSTGS